jgi:hypothetical protein
MNQNLHAVTKIRSMAESLAKRTGVVADEGCELAAAYERLRQQAKELNERAWPDDTSFDNDVPPLADRKSVRTLPRGMSNAQASVDALATGQRAVLLAGQLAAWAQGHQDAFEIEARLETEAKARVQAEAQTKTTKTIEFAADR